MWWLWIGCPATLPATDTPRPVVDASPTSDTASTPGTAAVSVSAEIPWNAHELAITVRAEPAATVAVACRSTEDPRDVHLVEGTSALTSHALRMGGLLADHAYECAAVAVQPPSAPAPFSFRTPELADPLLPTLEAQTFDDTAGQEYILANHSRDCVSNGHRMLVFDREGRIRWHGNAPQNVGPSLEFTYEGQSRFAWGGGWGPHPQGRPRLVDLFGGGELEDSGTVLAAGADGRFHHDGKRLADGRYLTLEEAEVTGGTQTFQGFRVRRVDLGSGQVDFDYHSQRGLDEGHLPAGRRDAWHPNWVDIDDIGGSEVLLVSLCYLSQVVAIDVDTGAWRWTFGRDGDFALVDATGKPLGADHLPQCQHGLQFDGDRLLVYDNGWDRGYSSVVEFELNEQTRTATERWRWTEPDWYETTLGSVDWLPDGRVLVGMGHADCFSSNQGDRSTVVEIDPARGTKLWEARYTGRTDMLYRADWADPCALFANAAYCGDVADRVAELAPQLWAESTP